MSENTGMGSSGSWRDDDRDSTHGWKDQDQARHIKHWEDVRAFETQQRKHVAYQPVSVRARKRQAAAARLHGNLKPMRFVSLHHHSTFSFLDGFQLPDAHVRRATEINMQAIAMTEHGNIFSHVRLEKAAEEQGVKPIFGCEFYMGWTDDRRAQKKNHITVIAKNEQGYHNLLALVTRSWREGFYYEPTVDPRWLVEHRDGLVILSGCQGSALFTALVGGKHVAEEDASYARGLRVARWFAERFEDYYIEVQAFPELEATRRANPLLARIARMVHRPLVATMDCHYTAPEETEIQQVLHAIRPGEKRTVEEMVRDWGYDVPLCPPVDDRSIYRRLRATGLTKAQAVEAIVSTEEIAQGCNVTLPKLPRFSFPLPDTYETHRELWRDWLREGWFYRGCNALPAAERRRYRERLKHEMEVIEAKDFESYFLVVADSVRFAKDQQIPVGPARGSAAGSLACWLLRITEVDPLEHDLLFERFIDYQREDLPDIDLDFATYGRPIVREYLVDKYGAECVHNVGTFTMFKSKQALDDAAFVHHIPKWEVAKVKELLVERSSGDLRASATIEDTVDQFDAAYDVVKEYPSLMHAMDLEGNARGFGIHAAGLVVSTGPITNVTAVLERTTNGEVRSVVGMDKYDAERQGLEKLDYLSLKTMDMIAEALRLLDMRLEELYALPLDDPVTIEGFQRNDVVGVFQFDGRATRIVNGILKPDSFHEIVCVNALSRPGPLHNGAVQGYVGAKWGTAEPERIHPALDLITEDTHYQIIFQEQILRIITDIGNFDWTHSAYVRRIISKKLGDAEFNRQWKTFLRGALSVHEREDVPAMDEATAKRIWGMCITAGSYAFNKAHSASYGKIAYWTMWLKQHHPVEFYAAALARLSDQGGSGSAGERGGSASGIQTMGRHLALMRDAVKGSGPRKPTEVIGPRLDSGATWRAESGAVVAGWEQVPGIGAKTAARIAEAFPDGLASFEDLGSIRGIGPKTIDKVTEFSQVEDPFRIHALENALDTARDAIQNGELGDLPVPTHSVLETFEAKGLEPICLLGQPVHRNLRDVFEANRAKYGTALDPKQVKRPDLSQWMVMLVRDADDLASVVVSRYKYPAFKEVLWKIQLDSTELVLIRGKKGKMAGTIGGSDRTAIVFVDDLWVIETDD